MRIFFLSEKTCALTVGGAYLGLVDGFERSVELDPGAALPCRLDPGGEFLPVCFRLDDGFLLSPPPQVSLYFSESAVAVFVSDFLRADQSFRVLWQRRFKGCLFTLVLQGKVLLFFGSDRANIIELEDGFQACTPEETPSGVLLVTETAFALVSYSGELLIKSEGKVLSAGETLRAEVPFHDSLRHSALCEWRGAELVSCTVRTPHEPSEATFALALFESALIGADCTPFLAENLAHKADSLKEYLGDYRSVVLTGERDRVGLVYERRARVYDVRYFRVEIADGKIKNIRPDC